MTPTDETPETIEADYALSEEEEAPPLPDSFAQEMPANNPTHRRLRAIAGAGVPYVLLTFVEDTEQVSLDFWGVDVELLPELLVSVAAAVTPR
jgi:hypothetical protein